MIEMLGFSITPRAMRVETNSGQEKVEHFALSMLNHFKNRCNRSKLRSENRIWRHFYENSFNPNSRSSRLEKLDS
jgi:hypothetical protein